MSSSAFMHPAPVRCLSRQCNIRRHDLVVAAYAGGGLGEAEASVRSARRENSGHRHADDFEVEPKGPVFDVIQIELHHILEGK